MNETISRRSIASIAISGIGLTTVLVHGLHLVDEQGVHSSVLGAGIPFMLSITLIGAGVWLYRAELPGTDLRIVTWTGVGIVTGIGFGYPIIPYQASHGILLIDVPFIITNWATGGAVAGFVIGIYNCQKSHYRKELEEERAELKERQQELERQNERLDQFASVVSHDLRSPLNVAAGRVQLAQQEAENPHLAEADNALQEMNGLIGALLELARQGQPIDDTDTVNISSLGEEAWMLVDSGEAVLEMSGDLTAMADPDRLQQLLGNLFRNAIDHGGEDVTIRLGALESQAGFYVADDGPGIPAAERDEVFESGYTTGSDGSGFGLAIVSEIVNAHGWDIRVVDSEDGGARFEITGVEMPARDGSPVTASAAA